MTHTQINAITNAPVTVLTDISYAGTKGMLVIHDDPVSADDQQAIIESRAAVVVGDLDTRGNCKWLWDRVMFFAYVQQ